MSRNHEQIKNDPRWKRARADCLARDDHACVVCGATEDLQADHIIELDQAPELAFDLDNLQTLCQPHHTEKGRNKGPIERMTWLNPNYPELKPIIDSIL